MKKVLIVDDDRDILEVVQMILKEAGYDVKSIADSDDVLSIVHTYQPDLILLDLVLSVGMDGGAVCEHLKKNPATRHIPIIMFSAHPLAEKKVKSYGADNFMPKPFQIDKLLSMIAASISWQ